MKDKQKSIIGNVKSFFVKSALIVGIMVAFYKLPSMLADKISYLQLKNKKIKQNFTEED